MSLSSMTARSKTLQILGVHLMRISVATAVACLSLGAVCATEQARAAIKKQTDIPAQDLSTALQTLAKDRNLQVVFVSEEVNSLRTAGASGELTADEAITKLLNGTELTYRYLDEKTITVAPTAVIAAESTSAKEAQKNPSFWGQFRLARLDQESADAQSLSTGSSDARPSTSPLEEIIVTAQRREERLQNVPISISVMSGEELDRNTDRGIADALNRVPGVVNAVSSGTARNGSTAGSVVVRGVAPDQGAGPSGTTAVYLDSIPFGFVRRSYLPDPSAYDMERVEVLRGPQGTLYGLSSLNGVVRLLTKDADLDRFEFKGRTVASSTEHGAESYRGDAALNVPIMSGKLAVRAVAGYQDIGGWIDKPIRNDANDAQIGNYRLKINAQPTDELSIGLLAWYSRTDVGAPPNTVDGVTNVSVVEEPSSTDFDAYGAKIGYEFSKVSLTSMTSYVDYSNPARVDYSPFIPGQFLNLEFGSEVFSQEFSFNSTAEGPWRWAAGGIYRDAKDRLFTTRTIVATGALGAPYIAPTIQDTYSESFAVFGELTREFFDGQWELTAGLRYFEDTVEENEVSRNTFIGGTVAPPPPSPLAGQTLVKSTSKFDHTAPRLVLSWHPTEQATLYASYGEGFRSGVNQTPSILLFAPQYPPAKPDTLTNYEVGAKGSLLDGRLGYETAVFYIDWKGVQQTSNLLIIPPPTNLVQSATFNATSASGAGFEFALTAKPVKGLTLGASYSWNDLEVDEDVLAFTGAGVPFVFYAEGTRLSYSAKYTAGGFADYAFPVGSTGYQARISTSVNHLSERIAARQSAPAGTIFFADPVTLIRASLGVEAPGGWTVSIFGDNLGNEKGVDRDQFSPRWNTALRPRTIGLQFDFRY
jgi:outer membrane receptor protein involved in Fe transport